MAGFFQEFSTGFAAGFFGNEYLRDFTHASKTFRTNGYAYSPKFKFLFHVYFDINKDFVPLASSWPEDQNFGLAVKTVQLPKYTFDLHTLNQYNRKRVIQTKIKYDPINITLHDDNANLIRKLWYTYYSYYFKDPTQAESNAKGSSNPLGNGGVMYDLNRRSIYDNNISGSNDWGYIGESGTNAQTNLANAVGATKAPFFKAINIYGFNQHSFVLYRLINPIIESWSHDTYDYAQGNGTMEHQMSIQYETVKYYEGGIDGRTPDQIVEKFGTQAHYDRTLSPITRPGANATILGQGGLVDAAGGIVDDLEKGDYIGAIQKAGTAANTFKNPQNILKIAKGEVLSGASDYLRGTPNRNTLFNFPSAQETANTAKSKANDFLKGIFK
jgi:hypothetical protein